MLKVLLIFLVCAVSIQASADPPVLPVFKGAEGFGTRTSGGRNGIVCKVTNLNDSGAGSLRDCIDNPKPRIIIFTTGGIIHLESNLTIRHPYLSIFGQTAPGDGILITGIPAIQQALMTVATHDVVVQHLRFRTSLDAAPDCCSHVLTIAQADTHDNLANIVLDHCSFSGGIAGIIASTDNATDITLSYNIIGPGRKQAVKDAKESGNQGVFFKAAGAHAISLHHNLILHSQDSNPGLHTGNGIVDIVNNLIYNWERSGAEISSQAGNMQANLIHNLYIMGKDSQREVPELTAQNAGKDYQLFLEENLSIRDPEQPEPLPFNFSLLGWPTADWESNERFPAPPITTFKAPTLLDKLLPSVGATLPHRDALDRTAVNDTRKQQGNIPLCPGLPYCPTASATTTYASGSPTPDKDDDGIPDTWEQANTLDPEKPDATEDRNVNGYSNIEEWIFNLTPSTTLAQHHQKAKAAN